MCFLDRGGEVVGLSPNIRVYRYSKGQYFDCHCKHRIPHSHLAALYLANSFPQTTSRTI